MIKQMEAELAGSGVQGNDSKTGRGEVKANSSFIERTRKNENTGRMLWRQNVLV